MALVNTHPAPGRWRCLAAHAPRHITAHARSPRFWACCAATLAAAAWTRRPPPGAPDRCRMDVISFLVSSMSYWVVLACLSAVPVTHVCGVLLHFPMGERPWRALLFPFTGGNRHIAFQLLGWVRQPGRRACGAACAPRRARAAAWGLLWGHMGSPACLRRPRGPWSTHSCPAQLLLPVLSAPRGPGAAPSAAGHARLAPRWRRHRPTRQCTQPPAAPPARPLPRRGSGGSLPSPSCPWDCHSFPCS
jgi:hypothetical protein